MNSLALLAPFVLRDMVINLIISSLGES
jgi:hypothetical protein